VLSSQNLKQKLDTKTCVKLSSYIKTHLSEHVFLENYYLVLFHLTLNTN